ncbi:MAG: NTP transferase domain-containing protein [Nanoarchaeota archaeon]|nr:NTP transferase domain-containing protein [Nanoarchaeota archaeon]
MKGVILAGGTATRLAPCTDVTNKHLLPVYNKPMIYFPLETLISGGIRDIMIVSGKDHAGDFAKLLASGQEFGVNLSYRVQEEAGGIAQALSLAGDFADDDGITVILGDNIFEDEIRLHVQAFKIQGDGARIFLKEVNMESARRFGIAVVEGDRVTYVEEKPENPKSNLAMTGLYMFDKNIFHFIKDLKPSERGEFEITDAIDIYCQAGTLGYNMIQGFWSDAGTFESLYRASTLVKEKKSK